MANPPEGMTRDAFIQTVDHVIRQRKTAKIQTDPDNCVDLPESLKPDFHNALREAIAVAGWAPFHHPSPTYRRQQPLNSPVPWRFYMLDKPVCCEVLSFIKTKAQENPDSEWAQAMNKRIPKLLAGAGALALVTWLPEQTDSEALELNHRNIEHVAAASAAIQNLLLAATARGVHTYWSSGGVLNEPEIFDLLCIPKFQSLLGSIFLAPADAPHDENIPGGLRDRRGDVESWSTWITSDALTR
jgi:nitroreductase